MYCDFPIPLIAEPLASKRTLPLLDVWQDLASALLSHVYFLGLLELGKMAVCFRSKQTEIFPQASPLPYADPGGGRLYLGL